MSVSDVIIPASQGRDRANDRVLGSVVAIISENLKKLFSKHIQHTSLRSIKGLAFRSQPMQRSLEVRKNDRIRCAIKRERS
ncbi:hypothetical protein V2G26_015885 [Clonostachys chloroleuca]